MVAVSCQIDLKNRWTHIKKTFSLFLSTPISVSLLLSPSFPSLFFVFSLSFSFCISCLYYSLTPTLPLALSLWLSLSAFMEWKLDCPAHCALCLDGRVWSVITCHFLLKCSALTRPRWRTWGHSAPRGSSDSTLLTTDQITRSWSLIEIYLDWYWSPHKF